MNEDSKRYFSHRSSRRDISRPIQTPLPSSSPSPPISTAGGAGRVPSWLVDHHADDVTHANNTNSSQQGTGPTGGGGRIRGMGTNRSEGVIKVAMPAAYFDLFSSNNETSTLGDRDGREVLPPPLPKALSKSDSGPHPSPWYQQQPNIVQPMSRSSSHEKPMSDERGIRDSGPPIFSSTKVAPDNQADARSSTTSHAHYRPRRRHHSSFADTASNLGFGVAPTTTPSRVSTAITTTRTTSTITTTGSTMTTTTPTEGNSRLTTSKSIGTRHSKPLSELAQSPPSHRDSSVLPPLSWKRTSLSLQSQPAVSDTASDISEVDSHSPSPAPGSRLPHVQHKPVWSDLDDYGPAQPSSESGSEESMSLILAMLKQHHTQIEETLSRRLAVLRSASNLYKRNGGWPRGVAFAVEHVTTHGDMVALADLAKAIYSIGDDGTDLGEDRGELDLDYEATIAWLSALPSLLAPSNNVGLVLVGLKVLALVVPTLEHWIDTAAGIARSLGPDAIPDELRAQCSAYHEQCRRNLLLVDALDRRGRVGVAANEVSNLLRDVISKSLP